MKSKITIKSIANELGVSVSTVSKALRDNPRISEDTRKKVQAFAKLLNYKPNVHAQSLRTSKTKVIGVIIPDVLNHFFATVIKGIDETTTARGYQTMICLSNESYDSEVKNVELLTKGGVDGLLVSIASGTQKSGIYDHFFSVKNEELPLVLFDRTEEFIACDKVKADDIGGAYNATKTLIDSGCKKIAMINFERYMTIGKDRKMGYHMALNEYGMSADEDMIFEIDEDNDPYAQIEKLFEMDPLPDGIFAAKEEFSALAIKIANKKNIKIPEELSLISFANGDISRFSSPSITSVVQNGLNMGRLATELLIDRIEGKRENGFYETRVISTQLKPRNSTKN